MSGVSMRRIRTRWSIVRDRQGMAALEFALLAPILLLLLFGTVRVGYALGVQHALSQLAASAARHALPAGEAVRREASARDFVMKNAATFPLLRADRMALSIEEANDTLSVFVTMDVSDIPDIPIVSAAYRFPATQVASAVIAVQR